MTIKELQKQLALLTDTIEDLKIENKRLEKKEKQSKVATKKGAIEERYNEFYSITTVTKGGRFAKVAGSAYENDINDYFKTLKKNRNYDNLTLSQATWFGKRSVKHEDFVETETWTR
jgi:hypothetical protein